MQLVAAKEYNEEKDIQNVLVCGCQGGSNGPGWAFGEKALE